MSWYKHKKSKEISGVAFTVQILIPFHPTIGQPFGNLFETVWLGGLSVVESSLIVTYHSYGNSRDDISCERLSTFVVSGRIV